MTDITIKRALISVSDKTNLIELAQGLSALGVEIISTGGTSVALKEAGIAHRAVHEVTALPEMLGGRVKTLHPKIHGGILGRRDQDAQEAEQYGIDWIDLVVVNFYPFEQAIKNKHLSLSEAIEYIDIGGPTMVRAAAKNQAWVTVVTDPNDYTQVLTSLAEKHTVSLSLRQKLAAKAFGLTAHYDAAIHRYLCHQGQAAFPDLVTVTYEKALDLRYGENPHQQAAAYNQIFQPHTSGLLSAKQFQGKPLSYNNILDAEAAFNTVLDFPNNQPACVIVKHANPCGVALGSTIEDAYARAYAADATSAFGGIVALNQPCTEKLARALVKAFTEVLLAPDFDEAALKILASKPNLRVLNLPRHAEHHRLEMRFVRGGMMMQERDTGNTNALELNTVTQLRPTDLQMKALLFANTVVKHIKSNAILIARDEVTLGIGAGQVSRIDAVALAIKKAGDDLVDAVLASDAFFPFRDSIDHIAKAGVRAIIQPGGSLRDQEVIDACNEHGITMVFTGRRSFKH